MRSIKKILILISAVIAIAVFNVLRKDAASTNKAPTIKKEVAENSSKSQVLHHLSKKINQRCPMAVDADTRLDNTVILSNRTLRYNYTMTNMLKEEFDINLIESSFAPILLNKVRTEPGMKILRDLGVTFSYNYKDYEGNFIHEIVITPDQYK